MTYAKDRKRRFVKPGELSLEARLMRDGLLDVCLRSGVVTTFFRGRSTVRKLSTKFDGYSTLNLNVERSRGKKDKSGRRRERRHVMAHKLVMMKKLAVARSRDWRPLVRDIHPDLDVDHKNGIRSDNRAKNLRLRTIVGNRQRRPLTAEELAEIDRLNEGF